MSKEALGNLEVAQIIEDFLDRNDWRTWDYFLCVAAVANDRLKQIQRHCTLISDEFPPSKLGHYCNEQGIEVMRHYIAELRGVGL